MLYSYTFSFELFFVGACVVSKSSKKGGERDLVNDCRTSLEIVFHISTMLDKLQYKGIVLEFLWNILPLSPMIVCGGMQYP